MSDHQISGSTPTTADFSVAVHPAKSARRTIAVVAASALTAAAVGGGVWAWRAWSDQGAQPAEALPGNTLAYAALDLDPPGGQKVEAFKTLRKFPTLKKQYGLDGADDVWSAVVKQVNSDGGCNLDYDKFQPWIGDRVAVALVEQVKPEPVVVVQVKDAAAARSALTTISAACDGHELGYAVGDEWAVLARTAAVAARVESDAGRGTLAEDADFRRLTEAAGDPGLATLYVAPEAGKALIDATKDDPYAAYGVTEAATAAFDPIMSFASGIGLVALTSPTPEPSSVYSEEEQTYSPDVSPEYRTKTDALMKRMEHFDELSDTEQKQLIKDQEELLNQEGPHRLVDEDPVTHEPADDGPDFPTPELSPALRTALENFSGLGGVARFQDGGLELSIVGDSLAGTSTDLYTGAAGDDFLADLPDDTALAFGAGFSDGWADTFVAQLRQQFPFGDQTQAQTIASFEKATGLDLPGDLEALGGDGISVVIGSGFSPDSFFEHPEAEPVAVRLGGDPDKAEAALDKIRKKLDGDARLVSRRIGDHVVVGANAAYLDHLAAGGDVRNSDLFHDVVPDSKDATTVYFVNFDAGDWLAKSVENQADRKDAEPLHGVGMTVTKDGDQQKVLYRVSFDD